MALIGGTFGSLMRGSADYAAGGVDWDLSRIPSAS